MPEPADAAKPTRQDLKKSPALSILLNGPNSFKGRKVGVLVTDGVDMNILKSLKAAVKRKARCLRSSRRKVGGVEASDGSWIEAKQKIDGGPSVLYDAVALLPSEDGAKMLVKESAARDFVADAFAHMKFVGYTEGAVSVMVHAGVLETRDKGFIAIKGQDDCSTFVAACRQLRFWERAKM